MRKIFAILMALCLLTVFVSSASACFIDPKTGKCATYQPTVIKPPTQSDGKIYLFYGYGSASSTSSAVAGGDCPEAFHQDYAGTTSSGFLSQGIATATPFGYASSYGGASISAKIS